MKKIQVSSQYYAPSFQYLILDSVNFKENSTSWLLPDRFANNKFGEIVRIMLPKVYLEQPILLINDTAIPNVSNLFSSGISSFRIIDTSVKFRLLHQEIKPCVYYKQVVAGIIEMSGTGNSGTIVIGSEKYTYSRINDFQITAPIPDGWHTMIFNEFRVVMQVKLGNYFFSDEYEENV